MGMRRIEIDLSKEIEPPWWMALASHAKNVEVSDDPFLQRQYEEIKDELNEAIASVLPTGSYVLGPTVAKFEEEFAAYHDCKYAVGVSSGTSALHIALAACEVGPGDEVITVANTYVATAFAANYVGATPVFIDVDPKTYNMTAELVAEKITPKTRAIIPVHLYGHPVDMDPIMALAREHDLWVVEDCAHAHGATYNGRKVGSLGHLGCFSFYPAKIMGAVGDGGAITTNDSDLYQKCKMMRYMGQRFKTINEVVGYQLRLVELQAAMLRVKLRHLDDWVARRRKWAALYDEMLTGLPIELPYEAPYAKHVYYSYATMVDEEDRLPLMAFLMDHGVGSFAMYETMVPMQPCYEYLGYKEEDFPVAGPNARRVHNLPMFPEMREDEARRVAETIRAFYEQR
jgi:dTDP-4-amino-4,6-dideoxygalactose transaminase